MHTSSPQHHLPGTQSWWQRWWFLPVFAVYTALVFVLVVRHEPWFDEGQAWLLARDLHPWYLFSYMLRYEGSPGLWHLLLVLPAKCGLPYATLNIISGLIATGGMWIFLSRSPLPKYLTILFPFTFYLCFQYAIIARSYVLLPLLLFSLAASYAEKRRHPVLYTGLLCLLANVSVHGMLIASSLMFLHFLDLRRDWSKIPPAEQHRHTILLAAFAGVLAIIVWQLWLPEDLLSVTGHRESLIERAINGLHLMNRAMAEIRLPDSMMAFGLGGIVTAITICASLIWFWRTRVLWVYLLPTLALMAFFILKYSNSWHEGILFLIWLFALWRSFDAYARMDPIERNAIAVVRLCRFTCLAAVALIAVQLSWAFLTVRYDLTQAYSGSKAAARYLSAHHLDKKKICAFSFHANGILPYFKKNIFANFSDQHGGSFWFWSSRQRTDATLDEVLNRKPDVLILGVKFESLAKLPWDNPSFVYDISPQYRFAGYFDGRMYWKTQVKEYDAFAIYVRKTPAP